MASVPSTHVLIDTKINNWTDNDFQVDSPTPIALKSSECTLVLFYNDNQESRDLLKIWSIVSRNVIAHIGAVKLSNDPKDNTVKVTKGFRDIQGNPSNPLHQFSLKGIPAILVYRQGYPQAFYNGPRSVQSISDYALTLACSATYQESQQVRTGLETSKESIRGTYTSPIPTSSVGYNTTGLRGYSSNPPLPPTPQVTFQTTSKSSVWSKK